MTRRRAAAKRRPRLWTAEATGPDGTWLSVIDNLMGTAIVASAAIAAPS